MAQPPNLRKINYDLHNPDLDKRILIQNNCCKCKYVNLTDDSSTDRNWNNEKTNKINDDTLIGFLNIYCKKHHYMVKEGLIGLGNEDYDITKICDDYQQDQSKKIRNFTIFIFCITLIGLTQLSNSIYHSNEYPGYFAFIILFLIVFIPMICRYLFSKKVYSIPVI